MSGDSRLNEQITKVPKNRSALLLLSEAKEADVLHFSMTTGYVSNFYVLLICGTALWLSYLSMRTLRFPKEEFFTTLRCEFPSKQLIVKLFG